MKREGLSVYDLANMFNTSASTIQYRISNNANALLKCTFFKRGKNVYRRYEPSIVKDMELFEKGVDIGDICNENG